jgi:tRNA nucleotidyltransferase (CCA-adding enzyme)
MKRAKLIDKWSRSLPPSGRDLVQRLLSAADVTDRLYLVGGPVRDLLLGAPSLDVDICVEGRVDKLLETLGSSDLRVIRHARFLTATVHSGGFAVDLATARAETYERPGALPSVRPATVREDLLRRDFSINALALVLTGENPGELLDPAGGEADLRAGVVRVLHDESFRDDATRILRAARYEARLGFRLEPRTEELLRRDVSYLDTISGARVHHELSRTFAEAAPERALARLHGFGALARIHPALCCDERRAAAFRRLRDVGPRAAPGAYWPLLAWDVQAGQVSDIARRLALTKAQAAAVAALPALRAHSARLADDGVAASDVEAALSPYPLASVWALCAATESVAVREHCLEFVRRLRGLKTQLNGRDVLALGAAAGPQVGEVLRRLRVAKLNRDVRSRADEERFVKSWLGKR